MAGFADGAIDQSTCAVSGRFGVYGVGRTRTEVEDERLGSGDLGRSQRKALFVGGNAREEFRFTVFGPGDGRLHRLGEGDTRKVHSPGGGEVCD